MTIPSFKILKKNAAERVAAAPNARKVTLVYAGIITALAAMVTIINYTLGLQIDKAGGLSNMGLRTMLSTIQSVLPMVQSMVTMCLDVGFLAAMVRVSRQQFISEQTLKLGFDRFWVLLRSILIQTGMYMMAGFAAFWIAMQVYFITPLSNTVMDILTPLISGGTTDMTLLMEDEALYSQLVTSMLPLFALFGILYAVFAIPMSYGMRMTNYVIIDKPAMGAMQAIRESRKMMKGSWMRLFRLDLSLWWWYAVFMLSMVLCYGDVLLAAAGVQLPWSDTVSYFLFYALFLAAQFAAIYFLRAKVEVVYAQAYDALKPRETNNGVVLGNIFQM